MVIYGNIAWSGKRIKLSNETCHWLEASKVYSTTANSQHIFTKPTSWKWSLTFLTGQWSPQGLPRCRRVHHGQAKTWKLNRCHLWKWCAPVAIPASSCILDSYSFHYLPFKSQKLQGCFSSKTGGSGVSWETSISASRLKKKTGIDGMCSCLTSTLQWLGEFQYIPCYLDFEDMAGVLRNVGYDHVPHHGMCNRQSNSWTSRGEIQPTKKWFLACQTRFVHRIHYITNIYVHGKI